MSDDKGISANSVATNNSKVSGTSSELTSELNLWNVLNFTTVAALTSVIVVAVQTPIKAALVSFAVNGSFIPYYTGGMLGLLRALYAGTSASLSGAAARAAYVTGTKNNKAAEVPFGEVIGNDDLYKKEHIGTRAIKINGGYVASAAFGDVIVTQIPESLAQFKKIPGFLPPNFKWYTWNNAYQLMTAGLTARYISGTINFASMFFLEEEIANKFPIENPPLRHSCAGAVSGVVAAVCSYPFSAFNGYVLVRTQITAEGNLVNKSSVQAFKELTSLFFTHPKKAAKTALIHAGKQLPFRIALTSTVFATVAGVGEVLGTEPLARMVPDGFRSTLIAINQHRFFSTVAKQPRPEQKVQSDAAPSKTR